MQPRKLSGLVECKAEGTVVQSLEWGWLAGTSVVLVPKVLSC